MTSVSRCSMNWNARENPSRSKNPEKNGKKQLTSSIRDLRRKSLGCMLQSVTGSIELLAMPRQVAIRLAPPSLIVMVNNSARRHAEQLSIIAEKCARSALPSMMLFANNSYGIDDSMSIAEFHLVEDQTQWPQRRA